VGGNNLIIQGSPSSGTPGAVGLTYQLNSPSDYFMSVSAFPSTLMGTSSKTLVLWGFITNPGGGDGDECEVFGSFGSSAGCAGNAFGVYCAGTTKQLNLVGCSLDLGVTVAESGNPDLCSVGVWHQYAIAFDGSTGFIYFDGTLVKTGAMALNTMAFMDKIGVGIETWHRATEHHLSYGRVDEVKLYNYKLSDSEVAELYELRDHSPTLAPTVTPPCSSIGRYASFEVDTKCPLVHYDMSTLIDGQIKDLIGTNDLVTYGFPTSGASGAVGMTFLMNSPGDYFMSTAAYPSALTGANPKSLALWANIASPGTGDGDAINVLGSFGSSDGCAGNAFGMYCYTACSSDGCGSLNLVGCSLDLGVTAAESGRADLCAIGEWHHYVIAFDGSTGFIYFDGELLKSGAMALSTMAFMDKIGVGIETWHRATEHHLSHGRVDEVKLYDYKLGVAEVAALFAVRDV
jgi:hypothetical protein